MMIAPLRDIFDAARGSRLGRLADATALIQRTLQGRAAPSGAQAAPSAASEALDVGPRAARLGGPVSKVARGARERMRRPRPMGRGSLRRRSPTRRAAGPTRFNVPASYRGKPVPLIVMLHGCTQSPDDFAAGTRMNEAAEAHGCIVVYPGQIAAANSSKCWNWFNAGDQARDRGEPSLGGGDCPGGGWVDTRSLRGGFTWRGCPRAERRGRGAGGMHIPICSRRWGCIPGWRAARRGIWRRLLWRCDKAERRARRRGGPHRPRPTIVFHGDSDGTVNPVNGRQVIERAMPSTKLTRKEAQGQVTGGRAYSVVTYEDADGRAVAEQWVVHGGAHAWSGGSPSGSYTDPGGPDATREMVRFFLQHENAEAA